MLKIFFMLRELQRVFMLGKSRFLSNCPLLQGVWKQEKIGIASSLRLIQVRPGRCLLPCRIQWLFLCSLWLDFVPRFARVRKQFSFCCFQTAEQQAAQLSHPLLRGNWGQDDCSQGRDAWLWDSFPICRMELRVQCQGMFQGIIMPRNRSDSSTTCSTPVDFKESPSQKAQVAQPFRFVAWGVAWGNGNVLCFGWCLNEHAAGLAVFGALMLLDRFNRYMHAVEYGTVNVNLREFDKQT